MLAPLAIVLAVIALVAVISSSTSSSGGGGRSHATRSAAGGGPTHHAPKPKSDTYVVQAGDTLGGIAEKTGVSVEELQRLNPDIDTQALVPGSTLKLQ